MAKSSDRPDPDTGEAEDEFYDEEENDADVAGGEEFDSDEDEDEDDGDGEDGDAGGTPGRSGPVDRIKEFLAPRPVSGKVNTRRAVEQLDNRERRLSFAAAGASVVFGILIYAIETSDKSFRLTKGELTPQTTLVVGLVAGALLFGATLVGRRAPVGFVALFTFLAFGTRYLVGVPFLALAVWLLYRSFKIQKEAAAARRTAGATGGGTSSAKGARRTATPSTNKAAAPKAGAKKKGPARPEANKRYTPKRPPPPAPKPSRRERRATKASD